MKRAPGSGGEGRGPLQGGWPGQDQGWIKQGSWDEIPDGVNGDGSARAGAQMSVPFGGAQCAPRRFRRKSRVHWKYETSGARNMPLCRTITRVMRIVGRFC
ncbi:hypothetical protein CSHISOI_10432 [Colletotrichum shisoi]|uniref:Uncharacterized protein n=1 Tax=Colletotrichum shisoi TaxID=2078593 RepID=A0A5Q4BDV8_9PEZI|nr:hypothetical protein CSHISOI_10432 [Colletotrichum shisoi]